MSGCWWCLCQILFFRHGWVTAQQAPQNQALIRPFYGILFCRTHILSSYYQTKFILLTYYIYICCLFSSYFSHIIISDRPTNGLLSPYFRYIICILFPYYLKAEYRLLSGANPNETRIRILELNYIAQSSE